MPNEVRIPRWLPLVGGVLGSTTCGALLYAWSVFIKPLNAEFGWSRADIAMAFAIACLVFGLMTYPAGRLSDKYGPRKVVLAGGIILCCGFILSAFIRTRLELYITYGMISGLGGGLVYLPPIATAPKWWPDRKALATGFAVVGLGLGSFIMAPLATYIIDHHGWRSVFLYVGIAMGVVSVASAFCLQVPPAGWLPKGWVPPRPAGADHREFRDYTYSETIRTPQFWLLYAAYFCGAFSGLMIIGHIAGHGIDQGLTPMLAAGAASLLAMTNAATRVVSGWIADKIGFKGTFITVFILQVLALALLFPAGREYWALWAIAALIGWNYGALFTLFPATCLQYFGQQAQGTNYGLLFTSWGLAGFMGPFVGGWLKDLTGTYLVPFMVSAAMVLIPVIIFTLIKPPDRKHVEAEEIVADRVIEEAILTE